MARKVASGLNITRTVLARHIGVAGFREQVKAGDGAEALLGPLDLIAQLGVDKVGYGVPLTLHI